MESKRIEKFGVELSEAYKAIAILKWGGGFNCCNCGGEDYFEGKYPYSRRCIKCKIDHSPTTDTVFHGVRLPLNIALFIIEEVALSDNRISSQELSDKIETQFKKSIRQKTVWDFLLKVYNAIFVPLRVSTSFLTVIKFSHRDKTIIAVKGYVQNKLLTAAYSFEKGDESLIRELTGRSKSDDISLGVFEATFKRVVVTKFGKRTWDIDGTVNSILSLNDHKDFSQLQFAIDVYKSIAGVNSNHFQAYLNFFCFKENRTSYEDLLKILIKKETN